MLKIDYVYCENMVIEFDDIFKFYTGFYTLNEALDKAQEMFNKYGFTHAEILNASTEEVIVTIEKVVDKNKNV